jgi:hypothetical protein
MLIAGGTTNHATSHGEGAMKLRVHYSTTPFDWVAGA